MSSYTKVVDNKGVVRYKLDNKFVKGAEVPEEVVAALADLEPGTIVDETGNQPVDETENAPEVDPGADPDDVDDESGIDDEVPVSRPQPRAEEGMGFKRVNGKTVDIFDGKTPHTHIRFVNGIMVPLSEVNFKNKTDAEIQAKLRKLGKI